MVKRPSSQSLSPSASASSFSRARIFSTTCGRRSLVQSWPALKMSMLISSKIIGSTLFNAAISQAMPRIRAILVGWKQPFVVKAEVDQDRAAFEQLDLRVAIDRHLPERLLEEIFLRARVHRIEQADAVVAADLLQRPADAKVADQPSGERRNPAECADLDRCGGMLTGMVTSGVLGFEGGGALLGGGGVHPHHFPDDGRRDPRSCGRTSAAHILLRGRIDRPRRPCCASAVDRVDRLAAVARQASSTWLRRWRRRSACGVNWR